MALRRISQLDPVLDVSRENLSQQEYPLENVQIKPDGDHLSSIEAQLKWFVKYNPLLSGYLMEVSEWNGIGENKPSYYLSKQFDLSALITIISASITGSLDDMLSTGDWEEPEAENYKLSASLHAPVTMYRHTNYNGKSTFHGNAEFHRNVVITGERVYPRETAPSAVMTTSQASWADRSGQPLIFDVQVPSRFLYPINACSMSAWWADLAEVYDADGWYAPGTLVQFGGEREITVATTNVNAVVTSNPGFILNTGLNSDYKCPIAIALTGRTPVLVSGKVRKFDRITLDADNPGIGRVIADGDKQSAVAVALETNDNPEIKLVMCSAKFAF